MNKVMIYVSFLIILNLTSGCAVAKVDSERYLIAASAVKVEFLNNNIEGSVVKPSSWKVWLENVEVIHGITSKFPSSIIVELNARQGEQLLKYDQIHLLVDSNDKKPNVLYWEKVIKIACLPEYLVDSKFSDYYFDNKWNRKGVKCIFLKGFILED